MLKRHRAIAVCRSAALLFCCSAVGGPAWATVWYVDDSAPSGGDGSSWSKAFRSPRSALKRAEAGDEVRIGQGVYRPAPPTSAGGRRSSTFSVPDGVIVQGGYAGYGASNPHKLKPSKFKTILSGDLNRNDGPPGSFANVNDNSYHVVTLRDAGPATELRGLIIEAGNARSTDLESPNSRGAGVRCIGAAAPTLIKCTIRNNRAVWSGAGLSAPAGTPTLRSCTVSGNVAELATSGQGAGVATLGGTFEACLFTGNVAGEAVTGGGAINGTTISVFNCTFKDNGSSAIVCGQDSLIRSSRFVRNWAEDGGAIAVRGGGAAIIHCTFESNEAASFGGAVYCQPSGSVTVLNCGFFGNDASDGNAISNRGTLTAVNCAMVGHGEFGGFTLRNLDGEMELVNCTIAHNDGHGPGAGLHVDGGSVAIRNSILWANGSSSEDSQIWVEHGAIDIANSCVQGWTGAHGGSGNNATNPRLMDPNGPDNLIGTPDDNCRLESDSPCHNAADASWLPADDFDLDDDGDTGEPVPLDLDFEARISAGGLDRGAYES